MPRARPAALLNRLLASRRAQRVCSGLSNFMLTAAQHMRHMLRAAMLRAARTCNHVQRNSRRRRVRDASRRHASRAVLPARQRRHNRVLRRSGGWNGQNAPGACAMLRARARTVARVTPALPPNKSVGCRAAIKQRGGRGAVVGGGSHALLRSLPRNASSRHGRRMRLPRQHNASSRAAYVVAAAWRSVSR